MRMYVLYTLVASLSLKIWGKFALFFERDHFFFSHDQTATLHKFICSDRFACMRNYIELFQSV